MTSEVRDLGVIMSSSGTFENQVNQCSTKGSQMAGQILRTFRTRESGPMLLLYKALVLPFLEYCCQLWSPKKLNQIRKLESVQRHFTRRIAGTDGMSYSERLKYLKMYSLERRRDRYVVIYVWKIIQGLVPNLLGRDKIKYVSTNPRIGRYSLLPFAQAEP